MANQGSAWRRLGAFVVASVVFIALLVLGFWQYGRYQEKLGLIQDSLLAQSLPATRVDSGQALKSYLGKSVRIQGVYLGDQSVLWMNRFRDHVVGYEVLTPFKLSETGEVIMVNRGWIPMDHRLEVSIPSKMQVIEGRLIKPKSGFLLGQNINSSDRPMTIQVFDDALLAKALSLNLMGQVLELAPEQPFGFERHWPLFSMHPSRHMAYAGQWWLFALVWLVGCVMLFRQRGR